MRPETTISDYDCTLSLLVSDLYESIEHLETHINACPKPEELNALLLQAKRRMKALKYSFNDIKLSEYNLLHKRNLEPTTLPSALWQRIPNPNPVYQEFPCPELEGASDSEGESEYDPTP